MYILAIRSLILYIGVLIAIRLMGKRQIAQLQPFEFVVILIISEMVSVALQSTNIPLINTVIPIIVLVVCQVFIAQMDLKSDKFRNLICGSPAILISDGVLQEKTMVSQRLDINDILEQMRAKGFFDIEDIAYAILETNGQISFLPRSAVRPVQPSDMQLDVPKERPAITLIADGKINYNHLQWANVDVNQLMQAIKKAGFPHEKDVFLASLDYQRNLFVQCKHGKEQQGQKKTATVKL
ncbi:MAG: DUF421 domain-containing protein [Peptococcaceae bacterium]|jgi:uncharacterized membrane protein YcaP (DUF421 family)|nr:DUF421 domain-containing protein [Peptococcaceae bacterium]